MTTWKIQISKALEENKETWQDIISCTLSEEELHVDIYSYVGSEKAFTAWSHNFVYFPGRYDGDEWCASVPRAPNGVATGQVGSG